MPGSRFSAVLFATPAGADWKLRDLINYHDEFMHILKKDWLGKPADPNTPAGIASNLGYNLFITKGLTTTLGERIKAVLTEEVPKQFIAIIVTII